MPSMIIMAKRSKIMSEIPTTTLETSHYIKYTQKDRVKYATHSLLSYLTRIFCMLPALYEFPYFSQMAPIFTIIAPSTPPGDPLY